MRRLFRRLPPDGTRARCAHCNEEIILRRGFVFIRPFWEHYATTSMFCSDDESVATPYSL